MKPDLLLQIILTVAVAEADASDGRTKRGITLQVGGLLVSGYIASARDFALHQPLTDWILEKLQAKEAQEAGRALLSDEPPPDDLPEYIHLSDAHFHTPGQPPLPATPEGVFWRCRLSEVAGFHFGLLVKPEAPAEEAGSENDSAAEE